DGWRLIAVDRGGDDPRLPYVMAGVSELDQVVVDVNEAAGEERVRPESADVTDAAAMAAAVARAEEWGELEAIVANAGVIAEVAAGIAWLCGPAGAAVTGTTISIDGGLSI
ncbi:MAG: hypothetical protein U0R71_18020, partial [Solirubrobacterales bacterium]